jgi:hypothetical protein
VPIPTNNHTATISIRCMVARWAPFLLLACLHDMIAVHPAIDMHAMQCVAFVLDSRFKRACTLHTVRVLVLVPVIGPPVRGPCVQERTLVI